jgi:hypothetical protein
MIINGDLSKTFMQHATYQMQFKGDSLAQVPLVNAGDIGDNPNEPNPHALGFRLDDPYTFPKNRLKFISASFSLSLNGSTLSGPLYLKKIRLFGIAERST